MPQLAQVVHEWLTSNTWYRLIKTSRRTPSHEDGYVVEKASSDTMGATRWDVHTWCVESYSDNATMWLTTELARAIGKLKSELVSAVGERRG